MKVTFRWSEAGDLRMRRAPGSIHKPRAELFILCWFLQKDDTLKYLSPEEQETLQFFEQTIDSLDDSLEEQENRRSAQIRPQVNSQGPISVVNGPSVSVPNPGISATPHQEIIDLVHPDLDLIIPQTTQNNLPQPAGTTPYYIHADRKPEAPPTHVHRSNNTRSTHLTPSSPSITQSRPTTPQMENTSPNHPSEVNSLSFNHYGGKSIMVNSTVQTRSNPPTSPIRNEPKIVLPATDLPDILCSHISQNPAAPTRQEPQAAELNSYGGKSLTINPTAGGNPSTGSLSKSIKGPAPTPAPRPARHSYHGALSPPKQAQAPHPERRRSNSMFRPQGITVQFSGRGPMNDSRREALRKLGLPPPELESSAPARWE
uniref:Uncharacterized protein n=1 Tax=Oryzias latipes TaxID=8090 RepID=H2MRX4_ORYLA